MFTKTCRTSMGNQPDDRLHGVRQLQRTCVVGAGMDGANMMKTRRAPNEHRCERVGPLHGVSGQYRLILMMIPPKAIFNRASCCATGLDWPAGDGVPPTARRPQVPGGPSSGPRRGGGATGVALLACSGEPYRQFIW
jgi:hypothetical protein